MRKVLIGFFMFMALAQACGMVVGAITHNVSMVLVNVLGCGLWFFSATNLRSR